MNQFNANYYNAPALPQNTKLFVGGLSYQTRDDTFNHYFSQFGYVRKSSIMKSPDQSSRGFGFIIYDNPYVAAYVVNLKEHVIDGRRVDIRWALSKDLAPPPQQPDNIARITVNKLFVGGLHFQVTKEDLYNYFSQFGEVESTAVMIHHSSNKSRGFGFVIYKNKESIDRVLSIQNHSIMNRKIEVKVAIPKSSPEPQNDTMSASINAYDSSTLNDVESLQQNTSHTQALLMSSPQSDATSTTSTNSVPVSASISGLPSTQVDTYTEKDSSKSSTSINTPPPLPPRDTTTIHSSLSPNPQSIHASTKHVYHTSLSPIPNTHTRLSYPGMNSEVDLHIRSSSPAYNYTDSYNTNTRTANLNTFSGVGLSSYTYKGKAMFESQEGFSSLDTNPLSIDLSSSHYSLPYAFSNSNSGRFSSAYPTHTPYDYTYVPEESSILPENTRINSSGMMNSFRNSQARTRQSTSYISSYPSQEIEEPIQTLRHSNPPLPSRDIDQPLSQSLSPIPCNTNNNKNSMYPEDDSTLYTDTHLSNVYPTGNKPLFSSDIPAIDTNTYRYSNYVEQTPKYYKNPMSYLHVSSSSHDGQSFVQNSKDSNYLYTNDKSILHSSRMPTYSTNSLDVDDYTYTNHGHTSTSEYDSKSGTNSFLITSDQSYNQPNPDICTSIDELDPNSVGKQDNHNEYILSKPIGENSLLVSESVNLNMKAHSEPVVLDDLELLNNKQVNDSLSSVLDN